MKNIFSSGSKLHWMKNLYLRFKYGAGCCDVYGLDYFLAKRIIHPLKEFRRHDTVSYPPDLTVEKWEAIIDEMIWAFDYFINEADNFTDYSPKQMTQNYKRQQKGFELFGKYFTHLWF